MTTAQKQRAPALRFRDQDGRDYSRWEGKLIRDICEINPSTGGLPNQFTYIDLDSVYRGMLIKENKISKTSAPSRAQRILKENDVLFQTVRPYQQNNFFFNLSGDYVASTGYAQLRAKSSPLFLYYLLHEQKFVRAVLARCTGTSYPAINSSDIGAIRIYLPDEKEQQKIAAFLSAVDTKIKQLNSKKSLLEQYKKGMMQKLFSQEIRFKDEEGREYPDWDEKQFSTIAGKVRSFHNPASDKNNYACIELDSLSPDTGQLLKTFDSSKQKSIKTRFRAGDVLFGKLRPYLRKFYLAQFDGVCTSEIWVLRHVSVPGAYLYQLVQSHLFGRVANIQSGTKMPRSDWNIVSQSVFSIPSDCNEQQKIADFLSAIDRKIELVAGQIDQARSFKQGLLQQMFI
ncbi:MAG: restriction endonuclease subunit S [Gammaproteobacteria bacterium]|nr:restriction endonuclease subunit S [Gammaproteobacteria bacterium]